MKRSTALRNAHIIADKLKALTGIVGTPYADNSAVKIKRAWLFGSTAKGKDNPNDVDILVECFPCGRAQYPNRRSKWHVRSKQTGKIYRCARLRPEYLSLVGIRFPLRSTDEALRSLRGNLKKISFHRLEYDGEIAFPRIMLYPRNDLLEGKNGN